MSDDQSMSDSVDEDPTLSRGFIEPAFDVGPPGVGPVTGIHSGKFFQPPSPVEEAGEQTADQESETD